MAIVFKTSGLQAGDMMLKGCKISWAALAFSMLLLACDKLVGPPRVIQPQEVPRNLLDTSHPDFVWPLTKIEEGPSESSTWTSSSVSFRWSGNKEVGSYSYKHDADPWSTFGPDTGTTLTFLDEGPHTFTVKARHINGVTEEGDPPKRTFTVDAVQGPAVMFLPRLKTVSWNQSFTYDIKAEQVSGLLGCKLAFTYNKNAVRIDSAQAGLFLRSNGGSPSPVLSTIDNANGKATFELVVLGGKPKGVSGTGVLATVYCHALSSGSVDISFVAGETAFRDTVNAPVTIKELVNGRVTVR